jgi:hypothetical protein
MEVDKAEAAAAGEAGPSSKAKGAKGGKRFEIKKWSAVAMWSWAVSGSLGRRGSRAASAAQSSGTSAAPASHAAVHIWGASSRSATVPPDPPAPTHPFTPQICTDTCAICRNNLYEPSIEYQANPTGDPDHPGLSIAWGCCGHVFHLDCIQVRRWGLGLIGVVVQNQAAASLRYARRRRRCSPDAAHAKEQTKPQASLALTDA